MFRGYPFSKTTYYRRLRKAKSLGCDIFETPDNRGKHSNHTRGSSHFRWNDKRIITEGGYVKVRTGKGHPFADPNGYAYEHLLVWISAGFRGPEKNEIIHHINGDKTDNRIGNLTVVSRSEHNRIHNAERGRNERGQFVGKKAAGRLLDGREWTEFPKG